MQSKLRNAPGLPAEVLLAVNDDRRRAVLHSLDVDHEAADADFDRLTMLAAALMDAPFAFISLVDAERQLFKSCYGTDIAEVPNFLSFCAHAIADSDDVMVVTDAAADPRFAGNPMVTSGYKVRFYAGAPINVSGERIGTLCVFDTTPGARPEPGRLDQLRALASLASSLFALKEEHRVGILARAALAREEKRRVIAVEAASLASWAWDVGTDTIECDALLAKLLNLPATSRLTARRIFRAIDRRDAKGAESAFRASLAGDEDYVGEYRIAGTHPTRWLAARGRVIERDEDGNPLLVIGVNYDVSERKSGEERQRLLLRELNHRVKNTLATVQALATQTVRHAHDPAQFLEAFSGRLRALGLAHGLLSDREWRGIALSELIRLEVKPFDDADNPRIRINGEHLLLSPDQALGLGLILHELAGNALKHGSLSAPAGVVELSWKVDGGRHARRLVLTWLERGGPPVEQPNRYGFGSILIRRSLSKILSSEVKHEFRRDGVRAEISMPLEEN